MGTPDLVVRLSVSLPDSLVMLRLQYLELVQVKVPGKSATHVRLHTTEKAFTCELCGDSFLQNGTLKSHENSHSREVFSVERDSDVTLDSHMQIPYNCKLCRVHRNVLFSTIK